VKAPKFKKLFAQLPSLNQPQQLQVLAALHPAVGLDRVIALIAEIRAPGRRCPDCSCERCHRHGQANDLQRFRCCQCGRTFNDLTGTPLARLRHKGKWLDYLAALLDSRTVRSAAKQVEVHRNTAFRWRHRFLHWVKHDRPRQLTGIVEADETFLLESQKGSRTLDRKPRKRGGKAALRGISRHLDCILVARDRSGQTIDAVTGRGVLTKSPFGPAPAAQARSASAAGHRRQRRLPRLRPRSRYCAPSRQSPVRPAGAGKQPGRHPRPERECLSPALQGMAGSLSRRGVMPPAQLPGLVVGARWRPGYICRAIAAHRNRIHP